MKKSKREKQKEHSRVNIMVIVISLLMAVATKLLVSSFGVDFKYDAIIYMAVYAVVLSGYFHR